MSGVPTPTITWFKGNVEVRPNTTDVRLLANGRRLEITGAQVSDAGLYRCMAKNTAGYVDREYELFILGNIPQSLINHFK